MTGTVVVPRKDAGAKQRRQRNRKELRVGQKYHDFLEKTNPDTGKPFTKQEAAKHFRVSYSTFRNREALWHQFDPATGKGLTDEERRLVAGGQMLVTYASRKSLGERHYSPDGAPTLRKRRPISLAEMERLFDETATTDTTRRSALAACMGMSLEQAERESADRIDAQMDLLEQYGPYGRRSRPDAA